MRERVGGRGSEMKGIINEVDKFDGITVNLSDRSSEVSLVRLHKFCQRC